MRCRLEPVLGLVGRDLDCGAATIRRWTLKHRAPHRKAHTIARCGDGMAMQLFIDGRRYEVPDGSTILQAVRHAGLDLPTLCHDDRLRPSGACRLCLVEVDGSSRWAAACATPAVAGARVVTRSAAIEDYRRTVLTMMAREYPSAAVSQSPEAVFHRLLQQYGIAPPAIPAEPGLVDSSHPFISIDLSRCIACYRCVRICDELQGQHVWGLRGRGAGISISPDRVPLALSSCVSCGACVDTCPTGALEDASADRLGRADNLDPDGVSILRRRLRAPGRLAGRTASCPCVPHSDAPVSKGHLCVKGRYAFEFVDASDRITVPMIRTRRSVATRPHGTRRVALRCRSSARRDCGPRRRIASGSSDRPARPTRTTTWRRSSPGSSSGTNNVDCCARVCHAPSAAGLKQIARRRAWRPTASTTSSMPARSSSAGANATENHPIDRRAHQAGGPQRGPAHRRRSAAHRARRATPICHLAAAAGHRMSRCSMRMAHVIVAEDLCDRAVRRAPGRGAATTSRSSSKAWSPETPRRTCGVEAGSHSAPPPGCMPASPPRHELFMASA